MKYNIDYFDGDIVSASDNIYFKRLFYDFHGSIYNIFNES